MERHGFSDSLNYNYKHHSEEFHVSRIIYHIKIFYLIKQLLLTCLQDDRLVPFSKLLYKQSNTPD